MKSALHRHQARLIPRKDKGATAGLVTGGSAALTDSFKFDFIDYLFMLMRLLLCGLKCECLVIVEVWMSACMVDEEWECTYEAPAYGTVLVH